SWTSRSVAPTSGAGAGSRSTRSARRRACPAPLPGERVGPHPTLGGLMAKFLILANYTLDGVRGVQKAGGSARRDAVAAALETVGGKLESFHFAFGDHDAYVIAEVPDNTSAAAVALTVGASGGASTRTIVL